jgi:hypothetical protein
MPHYGTLQDYRFTDADEATDVRGSGRFMDSAMRSWARSTISFFDHSTGHIYYVVVDTGGWLSSNKFIVPRKRFDPRWTIRVTTGLT